MEVKMAQFTKRGVTVTLGNYTPRNNEFEKGLKYRLYVGDRPTGYLFSSIHEAKKWFYDNYFVFM